MANQLEFKKNEQLFKSDLNNLAYNSRRGIINGCDVVEDSPTSMDVVVNLGSMNFDGTIVTVSSQNTTLAASDPSDDRWDLILIDSTGTVSNVTGTPSTAPQTPTYDPDIYLVLAKVLVQNGVTTILNADIKDSRCVIVGFGGGGIGSFEQSFVSQTSVVVNHNLNDTEPVVQVYDTSVSPAQLIEPQLVEINTADQLTVTFATNETGTIVVLGGPTGAIQATGNYTQGFTSQTTVNVNHSLNQKNVVVQVYDASDNLIIPNSVSLIDANNLTVTFSPAASGTIVVNGGANQTTISGDGEIQLENLFPDTTSSPTSVLVGLLPVIRFADGVDNKGYNNISLSNDMDITQNMTVEILYTTDTTDPGNIILNLNGSVVDVSGDLTPASQDFTLSNTITAATAETLYLTTFNINSSFIISTSGTMFFQLERQGTSGSDTHTGSFNLVSMKIRYTRV